MSPALKVPQGIPRGPGNDWWERVRFDGPTDGEPDTVHVRLDPGGWKNGTWPPVVCLGCVKESGIWLLWVENRPAFTQLLCSTCGAGWRHNVWCTPEATTWAETHTNSPETITWARDDHHTADLSLAYVAQTIRRGVNNRLDR